MPGVLRRWSRDAGSLYYLKIIRDDTCRKYYCCNAVDIDPVSAYFIQGIIFLKEIHDIFIMFTFIAKYLPERT